MDTTTIPTTDSVAGTVAPAAITTDSPVGIERGPTQTTDVGLDSQPGATTSASVPTPPMLLLRGTLRQRGTEYVLEQQLDQDVVGETVWTTPRLYQLLATPATQSAVGQLIDRAVTLTGHPEYSDARRRISVVLDTIESIPTSPGDD